MWPEPVERMQNFACSEVEGTILHSKGYSLILVTRSRHPEWKAELRAPSVRKVAGVDEHSLDFNQYTLFATPQMPIQISFRH